MSGKISKIERQKRNPSRFAVYIDDAYAFGIDEELVVLKGLRVDSALSSAEMATLIDEDERYRAKAKAFELLSYRDHSSHELGIKLRKRGFSRKTIDWTLAEIGRLRLLDDAVFAHAFARAKIRQKPMGRRGLTLLLRQKGISDAILDRTIDLIYQEFDEQALARQAAGSRFSAMKHDNPAQQRKRLNDFLYRRGFTWDVIEPVLSEVVNTAAET